MATNPFLDDLGDEFSRKKFFEEFFPLRHRRSSAGGGTKIYNFPVIINSNPPTTVVPFQIVIGGTPKSTTKGYAVGGFRDLSTNEEYLVSTNAWSTKSALSIGRAEHQGAALNGIGVICGGDNGSVDYTSTVHYSPTLNSWTNKTAMPYAVSEAAGQAPSISNSLYIIGGISRSTGAPLTSNLEYNIDSEVWSVRAVISKAMRRQGAFSFPDDLHVVGGTDPGSANDHFKYVPSTNTWFTLTDIPALDEQTGSAYNTVGYSGAGSAMFAWDNSTESWSQKTNPPSGIFSYLMFTALEKIYTAGSSTGGGAKTCYEFTPGSNSWASKSSMAVGRYDLAGYSIETLEDPLIFFTINDDTTISATKKFISLQRRGIELFSIDTTGKFSGENSAIPQLMVSVDLTEAATNDTLASTSGLINNLNRIRHDISIKASEYLTAFVSNGYGYIIVNPYAEARANSYIGQSHAHTTGSDGADTPTELETAYEVAGYDFMFITDHDVLTADPVVAGILHINGVEETLSAVHITALDVTQNSAETLAQALIDDIILDGGIACLDHLNASIASDWTDAEIESVRRFSLMEVFNSLADGGNDSGKWDTYLSKNFRAWATAVDDCHDIAGANFNKGWIVVHADALTKDAIMYSLKAGNFYATTGPDVTISLSGKTITATTAASSSIAWIKKDGVVIKTTTTVTSDTHVIVGDETYVRIEITRDSDSKIAWSQPIFIDLISNDSNNVKVIGDASMNIVHHNIIIDSGLLGGSDVALTVIQRAAADCFNVFDGATEVFSIIDGGRVGIGEASPQAMLHINSGKTVPHIKFNYSPDNNDYQFASLVGSQWDSTAESEGYCFFGSGANSTQNKVHVGGGFAEFNAATDIIFWTAANATTRTGTQRMIIIANGNVGIGTETTPDAKLDVHGENIIIGDVSAITGGGLYAYSATPTHIFSLLRENVLGTADLSISAYGGIGLTGGKTAGPETAAYHWHLTNAGNTVQSGTHTINGTTLIGVATNFLNIGDLQIGGGARVNANGGTNDNLVINAKGTGITYINFDSGSGGVYICDGAGTAKVIIGSSGDIQTYGGAIFNEAGADKDFRVEGVGQANALFVQGSDGFVGIGTNAPATTLDVRGTFKVTQNSQNVINVINYFGNNIIQLTGLQTQITSNSMVVRNNNTDDTAKSFSIEATHYDTNLSNLSMLRYAMNSADIANLDFGTSVTTKQGFSNIRFWVSSDTQVEGTNNNLLDISTNAIRFNANNYDTDFKYSGATTDDIFVLDAGLEEIKTLDNIPYTMGTGGNAKIYYDNTDLILDPDVVGTGGVNIKGDTFWTGAGSGLPFANVYGNEIAWTQISAVQNTWYPIVDADMTSGELNLITHDGNGKITFAKAGRYRINLDFALEANAANVHIQVGARVNAVVQNAYNHTQIKFSNTQEAVSLSTIVSVSANDTLEAVLRTTDAGTPDVIVDHLVITAAMVGGA